MFEDFDATCLIGAYADLALSLGKVLTENGLGQVVEVRTQEIIIPVYDVLFDFSAARHMALTMDAMFRLTANKPIALTQAD